MVYGSRPDTDAEIEGDWFVKLKTDPTKIAFIICTNDSEQLSEAVYYLNRLNIPDGMSAEVFPIEGAKSMTSGYNLGMQQTDAKYKVYMHQDVFITNENFISEVIGIFGKNKELGILGMVGATEYIKSGNYLDAWDFGAVSSMLLFEAKKGAYVENGYMPAVALDGFILATQYDIKWREDLFDGWDFYDVSECMEFTRAGYGVGIVSQDARHPWCFHDTEAMKLGQYMHYRQVMQKEYRDIYVHDLQLDAEKDVANLKLHNLMEEYYQAIRRMIDEKHDIISALEEIYSNRKAIGGHWGLCSLKKIAIIFHEETGRYEDSLFIQKCKDINELIKKLVRLKYAIKRLEFCGDGTSMNEYLANREYSIVAIAVASVLYVNDGSSYMYLLSQLFSLRNEAEGFIKLQDEIQRFHESLFADGNSGRF